MLSPLVGVLVAVCFFFAARTANRSGLVWAAIGFGAYLVPSQLWALLLRQQVVPLILEHPERADETLVARLVVLILPGVLFGVISAIVTYKLCLALAHRDQKSEIRWSGEQSEEHAVAQFCQGCGDKREEAPQEVLVCAHCGEDMDIEGSTCVACEMCGQLAPANARFCPFCRYSRA